VISALHQDGACTIAHYAKLSRPAVWECRLHWARPDLNRLDYAIWGPCRSESTTAGNLIPLISWSRRSCWSDAHCRDTTSFAVCRGSQWRTHSTHISLTVCILQTDCCDTRCVEILIFSGLWSTALVLCKLSACIRRVAPSSVFTLSLR